MAQVNLEIVSSDHIFKPAHRLCRNGHDAVLEGDLPAKAVEGFLRHMRTGEADLTICGVDDHKDPLFAAAAQIGQRIGILFRVHKLDFALALQRRVGLPDGDQHA